MVDASSRRRERSNPETCTQMGSPKGALKLNRTTDPGRKPISSSLTESSSSVNPETTADSPGFIEATDLATVDTLFRISINNGEYRRNGTFLKIVLPSLPVVAKKKSIVKKKKEKPVVTKPDEQASVREDKSDGFDFGGIPARNLKKNLGC